MTVNPQFKPANQVNNHQPAADILLKNSAKPQKAAAQAVLTAKDLGKTYTQGPQPVEVLKNINLCVYPSERLAIVGSSGSGKTTLLNLLGGLDVPTSGEVRLAGQSFNQLKAKQRGWLRNKHLGFVYQFHHLLAEFTALENAAMPLVIAGQKMPQAQEQALKLLQAVGLEQRAQHKPAELSGGERQRVALARALVTRPSCVLLDEPTGNLDQTTASQVEELIQQLAEELKTAFVLVTHDLNLAAKQDKVFTLSQGTLVEGGL